MSDGIPAPDGKSSEPQIGFSDVALAGLATVSFNVIGGIIFIAALVAVGTFLQRPDIPIRSILSNFYALVALVTFNNALILVALFAIAKRFTAHPLGYFLQPVRVATVVKAVASALALLLLLQGIEVALKYGWNITITLSPGELAMSPKSWSQLGIVLVCFAAFVPFYEEYLFRGILFGWLRRVTPLWFAIVISAALFAAVHGLFISRGGVSGWVGTGEIFAIGCLQAWWVKRTNSLWPAYAVHVVNNAMAFTLSFLLPNWP